MCDLRSRFAALPIDVLYAKLAEIPGTHDMPAAISMGADQRKEAHLWKDLPSAAQAQSPSFEQGPDCAPAEVEGADGLPATGAELADGAGAEGGVTTGAALEAADAAGADAAGTDAAGADLAGADAAGADCEAAPLAKTPGAD